MPRYTKLVESLPSSVPFVGPEALERQSGKKFKARIGANENVFGPSPKAIAEMQRVAAEEAWQYADPENHDLRYALAEHHGVQPDNIMVGIGVDGLLGLTVRLLVNEGDAVVTSLGAYPTFNFHVAGYGGKLVTVPFDVHHEDPVALIEATKKHEAKLVYISNPDNPMGSVHDAATIQTMIDSVPEGAVLCLDEAYGEFADEGTLPPIDVSVPNVVRMRTFSKAYGMAGARVGYAIAHEDLATSYNKIRNHFGMNRIGQAGALAALHDSQWLQQVIANVKTSNAQIAEIVAKAGLTPLPSATNFVTVDFGLDRPHATQTMQALVARGIFVRMPFNNPDNRYIRISAGKADDMAALAEALPLALADAQASSST